MSDKAPAEGVVTTDQQDAASKAVLGAVEWLNQALHEANAAGLGVNLKVFTIGLTMKRPFVQTEITKRLL